MDEQNIPIDINTPKLLDWLTSRRHVPKDWQPNLLKVREKINTAIQDMPAHEGIIKLLSGQHINYFHCLKIVDILKETEADTKNLFGRYGSQRMKDWQEILSLYEQDNLFLAEAAQVLMRNVSFEVPGLRKQVAKLEQTEGDYEKKVKEYGKSESIALNEFNAACKQLGISGEKIKNELVVLVEELPKIYESVVEKVMMVESAVKLYEAFNKYLMGNGSDVVVLNLLNFIIKNGNTTTYEYTYGEKPLSIETPPNNLEETENEPEGNELEIDFSEIDASSIDFGDSPIEHVDIDWGNGNSEEGFEIVNADDLNLDESGIVVEKSGTDGGIARGLEALTLMDNPKTRDLIVNELLELEAFLKIRLFEMSTESDLLSMTQMQEAPAVLQMQTIETVTSMNDCVQVTLNELTNKRVQHLHNIKHSPKYVDLLSASLMQKLDVVQKMKEYKEVVEEKIRKTREDRRKLIPVIERVIENTKLLQRQIEEAISKKYKGRVVNIIGGVNML